MAIQQTNHCCERKESEDSELDTCESGILMLSGLRSSEISGFRHGLLLKFTVMRTHVLWVGSISPAWDQRLGYIGPECSLLYRVSINGHLNKM